MSPTPPALCQYRIAILSTIVGLDALSKIAKPKSFGAKLLNIRQSQNFGSISSGIMQLGGWHTAHQTKLADEKYRYTTKQLHADHLSQYCWDKQSTRLLNSFAQQPAANQPASCYSGLSFNKQSQWSDTKFSSTLLQVFSPPQGPVPILQYNPTK